jgi:hypothetical protein
MEYIRELHLQNALRQVDKGSAGQDGQVHRHTARALPVLYIIKHGHNMNWDSMD